MKLKENVKAIAADLYMGVENRCPPAPKRAGKGRAGRLPKSSRRRKLQRGRRKRRDGEEAELVRE
ncbi:MAG: hypothetical protein ACLRSW_14495 [Christensenellaceae bacterium]